MPRSGRRSSSPKVLRRKGRNHGPSYGLQFFGHVAIDGATGVMTVSLKDINDNLLWSKAVEPAKA